MRGGPGEQRAKVLMRDNRIDRRDISCWDKYQTLKERDAKQQQYSRQNRIASAQSYPRQFFAQHMLQCMCQFEMSLAISV